MATPLEIVVKGNVSEAESDLKKVQAELGRTAIAAQKTDSSLGKLASSMKPVASGSNNAAFALTNLGRVAQDLPFGFVGIQNNLNPLLESFQRLKAESGSTGGALKALGKSLMGAGGLGFALSIASAAFLIFSNGFQSFGRKSSEAASELEEANKKVAQSTQSMIDSVSKEAASIAVIVEQLKNESLSRKQRAAAIEELQRAAPQYFATLNTEKATIEQITTAYNLYAASVIRAVQAKVIEKQLEETVSKRIELQKKQIDFTKKEVDESGKLKVTRNAIIDDEVNGETEYQRLSSGRGALTKKQNVELQNLLLTEKELTAELAKIKPLDFKIDPPKDLETIADVLAKLARQIGVIKHERDIFNINDLQEAQQKISAIESAIGHLVDKFKLTAQSPLIINLEAQIQDIKLRQQFKQVFKEIHDTPIPLTFEITAGLQEIQERIAKLGQNRFAPETKIEIPVTGLPVLSESDFDTDKMIAFLEKSGFKKGLQDGVNTSVRGLRFPELKELFESAKVRIEAFRQLVGDSLKTVAVDVFSGFGEAIGNALGGGKDAVKGLFTGLFSSVGQQLQELGKFLIASAIKVQVAKKAFAKLLANPVAAIAVGIGLIALGALIKQAVGKEFPGFAGGVRNFRGGVAMVGERGPELVTLPRGSNVIPNNQLSSASGGTQVFIPEMRIAGQDLIVVFNRASRANSLNG